MNQLKVALHEDASKLFRNKSNILKIENLLSHSPDTFLKERPAIVIYYKAKPLGLYEKFCNFGGMGLTKVESYILAKIIELEYKVLVSNIAFEISHYIFPAHPA